MKIALLLVLQAAVIFCQQVQLEQVLQWKQIDYVFPTDYDKTTAIKQGNFIPINIFTIDVAVDYAGKLKSICTVIDSSI